MNACVCVRTEWFVCVEPRNSREGGESETKCWGSLRTGQLCTLRGGLYTLSDLVSFRVGSEVFTEGKRSASQRDAVYMYNSDPADCPRVLVHFDDHSMWRKPRAGRAAAQTLKCLAAVTVQLISMYTCAH